MGGQWHVSMNWNLEQVGTQAIDLLTTVLDQVKLQVPFGANVSDILFVVTLSDIHLHIDVATAQTGVSRFTQLRNSWR